MIGSVLFQEMPHIHQGYFREPAGPGSRRQGAFGRSGYGHVREQHMPSLLSSDLMGRVADGTNMNYVQCPRCGSRTGVKGGARGQLAGENLSSWRTPRQSLGA